MIKKTKPNLTLMISGILGLLAVLWINDLNGDSYIAFSLYYGSFLLFLISYLAVNLIDFSQYKQSLVTSCLASQILAHIAIVFISPSYVINILLVILAGQLPFFLNKARSLLLLAGINSVNLLIFLLYWQLPIADFIVNISLMLAFQLFSLAVSDIAVKETSARQALQVANAELVSTRVLLEQSIRQSERLSLSRDLHDTCGHQLTALLLNLEFLSKTVPAEFRQGLQDTKQVAKDLLNEIRNVVKQNKADSSLDLSRAIESLFASSPEVNIVINNELDFQISSSKHAEALLRISQEAVNNAVKYGVGKTIQITLSYHQQTLQLDVSNPWLKSKNRRNGSGLANMQARAQALEGTIEVFQKKGLWQVTARLPYREKHYD